MLSNDVSHKASEKLFAGFNCAQSVLYACCDLLQFDKDLALRLATGFGGGIAREGQICGAVSGGVLAISLRYGRGESDGKSKVEETYTKTREFIDRFKERHGNVNCRELIQCDLQTTEGKKYFKENDLLRTTCADLVKTASALAHEAIEAGT